MKKKLIVIPLVTAIAVSGVSPALAAVSEPMNKAPDISISQSQLSNKKIEQQGVLRGIKC